MKARSSESLARRWHIHLVYECCTLPCTRIYIAFKFHFSPPKNDARAHKDTGTHYTNEEIRKDSRASEDERPRETSKPIPKDHTSEYDMKSGTLL